MWKKTRSSAFSIPTAPGIHDSSCQLPVRRVSRDALLHKCREKIGVAGAVLKKKGSIKCVVNPIEFVKRYENMNGKLRIKLLLVLVFGIAMGFLESVVVVYLRKLYYPHDFRVHLAIPSGIVHVEMFREMMTIIMIAVVATLVGEDKFRRFYYFIYLFGIWDIFYYVGLKMILNWPGSFFAWDILFLVPVEWMSPVLAPATVALTMVIYGITMLVRRKNLDLIQILSGLCGGGVVFLTFVTADYVKMDYNWYVFAVGEGLILLSLMKDFIPLKRKRG